MSRLRSPAVGFFVLLLLGAAPAGARAQVCDTGFRDNIGMTVTPEAVTYPLVGPTHFTQGFVEQIGAVTIRTSPQNPNRQWYLCLRSLDAAHSGPYAKPLHHLEWSLDGTTWRPITTSLQRIVTWFGYREIIVYYRVLLDWTQDVPGTYNVDLHYTLAF